MKLNTLTLVAGLALLVGCAGTPSPSESAIYHLVNEQPQRLTVEVIQVGSREAVTAQMQRLHELVRLRDELENPELTQEVYSMGYASTAEWMQAEGLGHETGFSQWLTPFWEAAHSGYSVQKTETACKAWVQSGKAYQRNLGAAMAACFDGAG